MGQRLSWLLFLTGLLGVYTQDYYKEGTGERRTRLNGQTANVLKHDGGKDMSSAVLYCCLFNINIDFKVPNKISNIFILINKT